MNRIQILSATSITGIIAVTFMSMLLTPFSKAFADTTSTITGWLVPDGTHFGNSMILAILPMGVMVFMTWVVKGAFGVEGDIGVYFALAGLLAGTVLSDLSASGSNTNAVPFADIFVVALLFFLYWWNS